MTSSPRTPRSISSPQSVSMSTPGSSPPPTGDNDLSHNISDAMEKEEEELRRQRDAIEAEHDNRMEKERQKDVRAGTASVNERYKHLEFLLQKSQLYANIMLAEMTKEEEEAAKDGKREEQAEKDAEDAQRHTTRVATTT